MRLLERAALARDCKSGDMQTYASVREVLRLIHRQPSKSFMHSFTLQVEPLCSRLIAAISLSEIVIPFSKARADFLLSADMTGRQDATCSNSFEDRFTSNAVLLSHE